MESSLAEKRKENKSVAREILNHRKYFNAPKLQLLIVNSMFMKCLLVNYSI
jgi:hypothetical protein